MWFLIVVGFRSHYNLNLQSISVNGQVLPINPALFATASGQGAIIDSGTTLAYLAEEAYDIFIVAVSLSDEFIMMLHCSYCYICYFPL